MNYWWRPIAGLVVVALVYGAVSPFLVASEQTRLDLEKRMAGADRVVVASVMEVNPRWQVNTHQDLLIVSQLRLRVEETLRGNHDGTDVLMDMEGGTLDGLTLEVSDMPDLKPGARGVFMVDGPSESARPHGRGEGILELADDVVKGNRLTLSEVRRIAHELKEDR